MRPQQMAQGALFFELSIEKSVLQNHPMRGIDLFLDLSADNAECSDMAEKLEVEEVSIECNHCLALSLGFKSPTDPFDVIHFGANNQSDGETEL